MKRKVEVVSYHASWESTFADESQQVANALGQNMVAIYHIGSTAIPSIHAKPIIDMLVAVKDLATVDEQNESMQALGYEVMGEFGIADRRFFRRDNEAGIRTHHIHAFEVGSAQITRHLTFRDYMRVHVEDSQKYSELKQNLAKQHPYDIEGYMDGKDTFIKEIDKKANAWRKQET